MQLYRLETIFDDPEQNQWMRISRRAAALRLALCAAGGVWMALALPPCNCWWFSLIALIPVLLAVRHASQWEAWLGGWCWGIGWALPGFWFLREIHPAVPFLLAPVLALWPALWSWTARFLMGNLLVTPEERIKGFAAAAVFRPSVGRMLAVAFALAAWWTVLEFSRSTMLPWNNFSTAMWKLPPVLTLAAVTGPWGLSFGLVLWNAVLALLILNRSRQSWVLPAAVLILTAAAVSGSIVYNGNLAEEAAAQPARKITAAAMQGDISQRRNASGAQAEEALSIYAALTQSALCERQADLVLWPECAVPYPFRGNHRVCEEYRTAVLGLSRAWKSAFLIGTLDYAELAPGSGEYGMTNSAFLLKNGYLVGRYDKSHRVPFGEYIPFRKFLPDFLIRAIDMNRDLVPGADHTPMDVAPGVRAGVAICFESVFPYIARESVRRGANLLTVLSNDAWYPVSSEPEQHLANAVMRSVENHIWSLRCGNNGGSLLIAPDGTIRSVLTVAGDGAPELRRGRGWGFFEISVPEKVPQTFFCRYGDWFVWFCGLLSLAAGAGSICCWILCRSRIMQCAAAEYGMKEDEDHQ